MAEEDRDKPCPKRGRPARGSEGSRQREVLNAAENLFLEQGFGAVTMDAIAKRAGVSKKTIYCQFDTKEELFATTMRTHMEERHLPEFPADPIDAAGVEAALAAYLTQLAHAILGPVAVGLLRLSIAEAPRFPLLAQAFYREGAWRHIAHLSGWLRRQQERGLIAAEDAVETASMMTSFMILEPLRANALDVRALPTDAEVAARAKMIARIITRGLAKPAG